MLRCGKLFLGYKFLTLGKAHVGNKPIIRICRLTSTLFSTRIKKNTNGCFQQIALASLGRKGQKKKKVVITACQV